MLKVVGRGRVLGDHRFMMSHALLLRLFLSPSFFSVHVALRYLMLYADNIGITYYLTRRLADLGTHELRDVWGFIWCVQHSDSFIPNLMHGHRLQSPPRHSSIKIPCTRVFRGRHCSAVYPHRHARQFI